MTDWLAQFFFFVLYVKLRMRVTLFSHMTWYSPASKGGVGGPQGFSPAPHPLLRLPRRELCLAYTQQPAGLTLPGIYSPWDLTLPGIYSPRD